MTLAFAAYCLSDLASSANTIKYLSGDKHFRFHHCVIKRQCCVILRSGASSWTWWNLAWIAHCIVPALRQHAHGGSWHGLPPKSKSIASLSASLASSFTAPCHSSQQCAILHSAASSRPWQNLATIARRNAPALRHQAHGVGWC